MFAIRGACLHKNMKFELWFDSR